MPFDIMAEIEEREELQGGAVSLWLKQKEIAESARPGQFIHIGCGEKFTLRRPISICDKKGGSIRVVFENRGSGTAALQRVLPGDKLPVLGALGNGFPEMPDRVLLVGGGIGVPPMLLCAKESGNADAVLGFRSADKAILRDEIKALCGKVLIATDDGSLGEKGTVTPLVERMLKENAYRAVLACGPKIMLRFVAALCEKAGVSCFVSLEERMGCGVGACLTCSCGIKKADGEHYLRVCKDGPVFDAREVCWDE